MLRLGAASGDVGVAAGTGGTKDIRPLWSGDGGRRCVGDGKGTSGMARPGRSTSLVVVGPAEPVTAAGATYLYMRSCIIRQSWTLIGSINGLDWVGSWSGYSGNFTDWIEFDWLG